MSRDNDRAVIEAARQAAGIAEPIVSMHDLSGGCIHRVVKVSFARHQAVVAKVNDANARALFEAEAQALAMLVATGTVVTPRTLAIAVCDGRAAMLMTHVKSPGSTKAAYFGHDHGDMWHNFGRDLAALHMAELPAGCALGYGFVIDNHIGSTPQPNGWLDDWVMFNAERRLGHQVRLARARDLLDDGEVSCVETIIARLDRLLPRKPRPSLLHGDLWSGNALPATRETGEATCAMIDPASYVGDALADLAMMRLFGGFAEPCFDAWRTATGIDPRSDESSLVIAVYQLYHVLNHVNIFGRGYVAQAMELVRRLT